MKNKRNKSGKPELTEFEPAEFHIKAVEYQEGVYKIQQETAHELLLFVGNLGDACKNITCQSYDNHNYELF